MTLQQKNSPISIEAMQNSDWDAVKSIFQEGIDGGNATFSTTLPTWEQWDESHLKIGRFVAKINDKVVGWIALSPFSTRDFHRGVVEDSIYLSSEAQGYGIGSKLLEACLQEADHNNIWLIQSQIFVENLGSIKLHEKFGFYEVGVRQGIGKLNGVWRDVLLMDRRSKIAGID